MGDGDDNVVSLSAYLARQAALGEAGGEEEVELHAWPDMDSLDVSVVRVDVPGHGWRVVILDPCNDNTGIGMSAEQADALALHLVRCAHLVRMGDGDGEVGA